jgi:hypothetical protein
MQAITLKKIENKGCQMGHTKKNILKNNRFFSNNKIFSVNDASPVMTLKASFRPKLFSV